MGCVHARDAGILQEEADVIIEAYNAAGGQAGGQKYYEGLYRSGVDELKSIYSYGKRITNIPLRYSRGFRFEC